MWGSICRGLLGSYEQWRCWVDVLLDFDERRRIFEHWKHCTQFSQTPKLRDLFKNHLFERFRSKLKTIQLTYTIIDQILIFIASFFHLFELIMLDLTRIFERVLHYVKRVNFMLKVYFLRYLVKKSSGWRLCSFLFRFCHDFFNNWFLLWLTNFQEKNVLLCIENFLVKNTINIDINSQDWENLN